MKKVLNSQNRINQLRTQIIAFLSHTDFVSGEDISKKLSITRSSVSNHVKALNEIGLDIYSVSGRGYRLARALDLLDQNRIRHVLSGPLLSQNAKVWVENIVTSTNDIIKGYETELNQGSVCLAEAQTQGRGRRGRKWVSPFGSSIYLSMIWRFDGGYQSMAGLSLLVGIAVNNALKEIGLSDCQLKWPNDVYHRGKKLAGILIEVEGQVGEMTTAVIGIGINVNLPEQNIEIDQAYTDVSEALGKAVQRNEFAAILIQTLWSMLEQFQNEGLVPFMAEWRKADLFYGQAVSLASGSFNTQGISRGIDESGALLLEQAGVIKAFHGGEISVRRT